MKSHLEARECDVHGDGMTFHYVDLGAALDMERDFYRALQIVKLASQGAGVLHASVEFTIEMRKKYPSLFNVPRPQTERLQRGQRPKVARDAASSTPRSRRK